MATALRAHKAHAAIRITATLVTVVIAVVLGTWAFCEYEYAPWTRNGRVRAYVVDTAPEVAGRIMDVPVKDNQFVHKGDVLYTIDSRDFDAAAKRAQAALDAARVRLALGRQNARRRVELPSGDVSQEERQIHVANADVGQADVYAADAALAKAQADLERCQIRSPVNGWITNLTVRAGNYANVGQRQLSVVDADSFWIYGYFEETRLRGIRAGAKARATLMGYPESELTGHVDSIGRGIADADAAPDSTGLPQVNPVFTWIRLAQRIPVRIHIDSVPGSVHLAAGETCTIHIDTREERGKPLILPGGTFPGNPNP